MDYKSSKITNVTEAIEAAFNWKVSSTCPDNLSCMCRDTHHIKLSHDYCESKAVLFSP